MSTGQPGGRARRPSPAPPPNPTQLQVCFAILALSSTPDLTPALSHPGRQGPVGADASTGTGIRSSTHQSRVAYASAWRASRDSFTG